MKKKWESNGLQKNKRKIFDLTFWWLEAMPWISRVSYNHIQIHDYFFIACKQMQCLHMKNLDSWELKRILRKLQSRKLETFYLIFRRIQARVQTVINLNGWNIFPVFCLVYLKIGQLMSVHKLLSVICIDHQLCDCFFFGNDFLTTLFTIQRIAFNKKVCLPVTTDF